LLIDNNKEFTTLEDEIGQQRLREENHNTRWIFFFYYCLLFRITRDTLCLFD